MTKNSKKVLKFIAIGTMVAFLSIILKSIIKMILKSDDFSWSSFFLTGVIIFFLLAYISFSLWIYRDCKIRGEDGILWVVVMWLTSPLIGLLIYFLKRPAVKISCPFCQQSVSDTANYCENCGAPLEESATLSTKKNPKNFIYLITGGLCILFMLGSLTGVIIQASSSNQAKPNGGTWKPGIITFNVESNFNNQWKIKFKSASRGYTKQAKMTVKHPEKEILSADITCEKIPKNSSLTLWLLQDGLEKSFDVTELSAPLELSLAEFNQGKLTVKLEINGVKDVTGNITLK